MPGKSVANQTQKAALSAHHFVPFPAYRTGGLSGDIPADSSALNNTLLLATCKRAVGDRYQYLRFVKRVLRYTKNKIKKSEIFYKKN